MQKALGLLKLLTVKFSSFLVIIKAFIPIAFALIITLISLVGSANEAYEQKDGSVFVKALADKIFAMDYNTYSVSKEFMDTGNVTLFRFLEMVSNMYIFFFVFVKYSAKGVSHLIGKGGSTFGEVAIALLIWGIIELPAVLIIHKEWFFPYKGFILGIANIIPMMFNIQSSGFAFSNKLGRFVNETVSGRVKELV